MKLSKIFIVVSALLIIASCTPAKIETKVMNDGFGPKVFMTNTSKTNKYEFTIKEVQTIVHYSKKDVLYEEIKTMTKKRTLNPGEQKSIGRSEYEYSLWETCSRHEGCISYHDYKVVGYFKIKP